jgi:hypothetical protein
MHCCVVEEYISPKGGNPVFFTTYAIEDISYSWFIGTTKGEIYYGRRYGWWCS